MKLKKKKIARTLFGSVTLFFKVQINFYYILNSRNSAEPFSPIVSIPWRSVVGSARDLWIRCRGPSSFRRKLLFRRTRRRALRAMAVLVLLSRLGVLRYRPSIASHYTKYSSLLRPWARCSDSSFPSTDTCGTRPFPVLWTPTIWPDPFVLPGQLDRCDAHSFACHQAASRL